MKAIIQSAIQSAISFEEYKILFEKLVEEGKTTGQNQSDGYVNYTKLNWSRYKRSEKHIQLSEKTLQHLGQLNTPITLLIITEAWCGDTAQILPVIEKMEKASSSITAQLVLRDEHEALMELFLTNGSKSIPKIIALNQHQEVLGVWGPRPDILQKQVVAFKTENPTATGMDVSNLVQKWYNEDKGETIQQEMLSLLTEKQEASIA